jgi:hypothetical protein
MSATLGRRLFQATTGYITYRTGQWSILGWGGDVSRKMDRSSVALGLAGATKKGNNFSCELQVKCFYIYIWNGGEFFFLIIEGLDWCYCFSFSRRIWHQIT